MALKDIITRLLDVVQDETGARVRFIGQPVTAPQNYPALYAEWSKTETESNAFGTRGSDGRVRKNGNVRRHTFNLYALAGLVLEGVAVDEATQDMADAVMDAIEGDSTLRGVMTSDATQRAVIESITPYMGEFGFGVQAEVSVMEL